MDRGTKFINIVKKLLKKYKIKYIIVSAYHPEANGMVERGYTPIKDILSKLSNKKNGN